jgi:hypothetical protein
VSDPLADLLLEEQQEADAEREERSILLQRITELRDAISELAKSVDLLLKMERSEQLGRTVTVTERDEYDRIKTIQLH